MENYLLENCSSVINDMKIGLEKINNFFEQFIQLN